jgi:hypothetical protein
LTILGRFVSFEFALDMLNDLEIFYGHLTLIEKKKKINSIIVRHASGFS